MSRLSTVVMRGLARRGLALQRHPGWRRQRLLAEHGVDVVLRRRCRSGRLRPGAPRVRVRRAGSSRSSRSPRRTPTSSAPPPATPSWTCVHSALGSTAGRQTINIATNSDSSSLLPMADEHRSAAPHVDYVGQEEITVARLDDVAPEHLHRRVPAVPQDRHPGLRARGAGRRRRRRSTGCVGLQLELSFVPLYSGGMLVDEAISFAYDHGFRMVAFAQGFTNPTRRDAAGRRGVLP